MIANSHREAEDITVNEEPSIFEAIIYCIYNKDYKSVIGPNNEQVTVDLDFFLKVNSCQELRCDLSRSSTSFQTSCGRIEHASARNVR